MKEKKQRIKIERATMTKKVRIKLEKRDFE